MRIASSKVSVQLKASKALGVLYHIKWRGRNSESGNSLRLKSLHWSAIFPWSLTKQEPKKAYFLAKKGLKSIAYVVNDEGHLLHFNDMTCRYSLGPHHRVIYNQVTTLILSLVHVPHLDGDHRIQDWMLQKGNIVIPMNNITTHSVYMLL